MIIIFWITAEIYGKQFILEECREERKKPLVYFWRVKTMNNALIKVKIPTMNFKQ